MRKTESLVTLDPIERSRKKQDSPVGRLFKTRHFGGKGLKKTDEFGHYLFCGKQRSGKTVSALWYAELLEKKYTKQGKKVFFASNMGIGLDIKRSTIHDIIHGISFDENKVYIFLIDEIQSWFPKDSKDKNTLDLVDKLTGDFSQLGKRQIYVLSTAQVYGRLNKNLREQCLYMVDCRRSRVPWSNHTINDFISGDDIMCDDLGRWSGIPVKIYAHGLPKRDFDTHRLISVN